MPQCMPRHRINTRAFLITNSVCILVVKCVLRELTESFYEWNCIVVVTPTHIISTRIEAQINWHNKNGTNETKETMNSTSPKSSLAKLGLHTKQRPIRIMVVGTRGIGKTGKWESFILPRAAVWPQSLFKQNNQTNEQSAAVLHVISSLVWENSTERCNVVYTSC